MTIRNTVFAFCLGVATWAAAEDSGTTPAPKPATPSAGLANDWLRKESVVFDPWDIGGSTRERFDWKQHFAISGSPAQVDFQRTGDPDNTFLLLRQRVHLGYTPCEWFKIYGEGQDASAINDDRNPSPEIDHYDLRQAWVTVGNTKDFPIIAKVGRQELAYGDQRLIGTADWNNISRTFDAAKLHFENPQLWVDAFTGRVVIPNDNSFNYPDYDDWFSGIYASNKTLVPWEETQVYFLARNVGERGPSDQKGKLVPLPSPRDIYTLGLRCKSLPGKLCGWDYEVEAAGQFGRFKASNTSPNLSQQAYAIHANTGYTWTKSSVTPRVGLEYNFSSGDSNPNDGTHETFDNLFPSNHKFYGYMDFVSWQNIHDVMLTGSITPVKKLTLKLDGHSFWLANTHDFFYAVNGSPRKTGGYGINPSAGSFVGAELDLTATYTITPFATLQAGYSHFFIGEYVRNSLSATTGATDANYIYTQLTFNF